jgi:hypothetical protein
MTSASNLVTRACTKCQFACPGRLSRANLPIIFHDITLPELPKEILVMRDDDELEVSMVLSFVDDATSRLA